MRIAVLSAAVLLAGALSAGAPAPAVASWAAAAAVASSRSASRLMPAGNTPSASSPFLSHTVNVTWTASPGGALIAGYEIRATDSITGSQRTVGPGCSGIVAAPTCAETGVPTGVWRYSVTPRQQNWHGAESARSAAVVVPGL
jgi:hypothetical protein